MPKSLKRDHLFHIFEEDSKNLRRCVRTSLTTSWVTSIAPLQCRTTPTQLPIGCHGPVLLPTPPPFISQHFYQHFSRWNRGSGIGDPPQSRFVKKRDTRGAQLVCRWCTFPFLFFHFDQRFPVGDKGSLPIQRTDGWGQMEHFEYRRSASQRSQWEVSPL